jgi:hypothetical protein
VFGSLDYYPRERGIGINILWHIDIATEPWAWNKEFCRSQLITHRLLNAKLADSRFAGIKFLH